MKYYFIYHSQIGEIKIAEENNAITNICISEQNSPETGIFQETELIKKAIFQLNEYFHGKRKVFELKLNPQGTEFQKKIWKELQNIPYGETRSYKQIAVAIGNEKACRAVGMANNKNPIFIVIPCHRVIGANGSLTGYGAGISIKEKLLKLEKNTTDFQNSIFI